MTSRFGLPPELLSYAAGLAHFRAGDSEAAVRRLRQVVDAGAKFPDGRVALPVMAMAYHDLGKEAEAEKALTAAGQTLDEWTSALLEWGPEQLLMPWLDVLECHILYREAYRRIRGSDPPENVQLAQIEQRALATMKGE